jgi:hypothetical protein
MLPMNPRIELTPIYKQKFIQFSYIIFTAVTVRELKICARNLKIKMTADRPTKQGF